MITKTALITLGRELAARVLAQPRDDMSFESIDTNNDGTISMGKFFTKPSTGRRKPEDIFKQLDAMQKKRQPGPSSPCPEHQFEINQILLAILRDQEYSL